jgi:hypothetical protein
MGAALLLEPPPQLVAPVDRVADHPRCRHARGERAPASPGSSAGVATWFEKRIVDVQAVVVVAAIQLWLAD